MRIAYFNATLRNGQDGVTRVMYKMFEAARANGNEAIAFGTALPEQEQMIIPMYKVCSVTFPLHKAYRLALPGYRGFVETLHAFQPDILHINSPCTLGFSAMKYARQFNVPIVATYHTHFPAYPRYYKLKGFEEITWKIYRKLYNNLDGTFVPALPILEELEEHGLERLQYLPNGVDCSMFSPRFRSNEWRNTIGAEGKTVLLFVSRLVWEKDIRILAQMHALLSAKRNDFVTVVVGDGHARAELEALMPGAHFLGFQQGKQLQESYASSDIFVFPSTTETFGLVTVEAMASGLVPVAAKVGGAAGIIENQHSGLFAQPHNAEDLTKQIEWLLDHPSERLALSVGAMNRARQFDWNTILDTLFLNYKKVIASARARKLKKAA